MSDSVDDTTLGGLWRAGFQTSFLRARAMDIAGWIQQAKSVGYAALSQASQVIGGGIGFVRAAVGRMTVFGSTETSTSYDADRVDEKHYFLIPDRRSEAGFSLYSMRCLPDGVPPINDLPKRRLFHLPNQHAMPSVEHILLSEAREAVKSDPAPGNTIGNRLNDIADQIDRLDNKLFHGVLLIGGLVALVNPLAGAAVAMKALLPSIGLLLSKYGLKYAGDTASAIQLAQRIKNAESEVSQQFREAGTNTIVNPLLQQFERALATSQEQYDPLLAFDSDQLDFGQRDRNRLFHLTCVAITNTYADLLADPTGWDQAQLGPEDVRFLKLLRELTTS
jgi:hypothetical protein